MRKAKLKVGEIVQVPVYEFAPFRSGWNGWLFQSGIITRVFKGAKTGRMCAEVEYPSRSYAQRLRNMRGEDAGLGERKVLKKAFYADAVFQFDIAHCKREKEEHPREKYFNGCYDADTEFLIDKGII